MTMKTKREFKNRPVASLAKRKTHRAQKVSNIPQPFKRSFNVNFTCTTMRRHQLAIMFTKRTLQALKAPIKVWWDIENQMIPFDLENKYIPQIGERIIREFRNLGYVGNVDIRAVGSIESKISDRVKTGLRNRHSKVELFFVGKEGSEVAHHQIKMEMREWLQKTIESGLPGNVLLIVGDKGYLDIIEQTVRSGSNFFLSNIPLRSSPMLKAMAKHFWLLSSLTGSAE